MTILTKANAELLATMAPGYYAREINGRWLVWDMVADHYVEFDDVAGCVAAIERRCLEERLDREFGRDRKGSK